MTELVVISAADDAALQAEISRVIAYLDRVPDVSLADVAYTCSLADGPAVLSVVADSVSDLRARLASACGRIAEGQARIRDRSGTYYYRTRLLGPGGGKLAFVFPGVTSFYPDMLRDLTVARPECREPFDELEEALASEGGEFTPSDFVFPPAPHYRHDADIFGSGAYAQALVATYACCDALSRLLRKSGLAPDGVVGFGGGDLMAMVRSGVPGRKFPRKDRLAVIREIYKIVKDAVEHYGLPKTSVISVLTRHPGEAEPVIETLDPDRARLSVDFSPRQKTLAVDLEYEKEVLDAFAAAGIRTMKLSLDRPFNTSLCAKLSVRVRKFLNVWMRDDPVCDIYSCARAEKLSKKIRRARDESAELWSCPVRFAETIRRMYDDGYRVFLEVGPRGLMTSAVIDTLRGEEHAAIALNSIHRSAVLQARLAYAQLLALGAKIDLSMFFAERGVRKVDFDSAISPTVRRDAEMRLSRSFPRMTLLAGETLLTGLSPMAEPKGRGMKAAARAAAVAAQARRQRQFDFGAVSPLVSDADVLESSPGISTEITKVFRLSDAPFIADFALGTSQLSYSDPNLKGLVLLSIPVAAEIMAEVAQSVLPKRMLVAIENFNALRLVSFEKGRLTLFVRAERVASGDAKTAAVRVRLREDSVDGAYTRPAMEATMIFADESPAVAPADVDPLVNPRSVHWSGRDVYPGRLFFGRRLRGVSFVDSWSEAGLDYDVTVPALAGNVTFTRFPVWLVNPLLMGIVVSGFPLWRSHEKFAGAFSFPFRLRRMELSCRPQTEGAVLKAYMRLTGVTPKSQICDFTLTDGNGTVVMRCLGWEEQTEHVPLDYRGMVLQPAVNFLTSPMPPETLGAPEVAVSSAFVTDVPYALFERHEELWLKTMSRVVLGASERRELDEMNGSAARRTEWLFGRIAAKEAVRRYLKDKYQARWSSADVQVWPDDSGKPHALGAWADNLPVRLDIAIAHTSRFVVALAAANARVGVDVESVSRDLSEEFTNGVFSAEELELAATTSGPAQTVIRFWCAKEAVSKALGTGIRYSPRELVIVAYDPDNGALKMRLEGAWCEAFKKLKGRDVPVVTRVMHEHALAFCFLPCAYFDDE